MRYDDASQNGLPADNSHTVARPDVDTLPAGSYGPAGGNAVTGDGTTSGASGADTVGAPPAKIVEIHGAGGATTVASGNFQAVGQFGVLTMDTTGNFNYVRNPGTPDGVKDVFDYTLADAKGANSSTTLTIDIGQVAAAAAGQGVVALPAGVELSDIHVNGRDLVVDMPDGTQMVIPGGAVFVPQLVIGDVQVPPSNLAALLIDSEPQPAAGTPPSSGGNFADVVPPLDPGVPLGDLIPPTELLFIPPEFEQIGQFANTKPSVIIETPDNPAGAVDATESVNEKGLPARGDEPAGSGEIADGIGTNNSDGSETNTGTIVFTAQDGLKSITIDGVAVTTVGQTIQGQFGTLTITSIDIASGQIGYSYTLADNTSGDNTQDLFNVVVTDSNGDQATASLTVHIIDDVPTARDDTDSTDNVTHIATGNVITGADTTSGSAGADTVGADNAHITAVSGEGGSDSTFDESGNLVVHGEFGTLTIHADGSYSYVLDANAPGGSVDTFTYTLTDGDGDSSTATLTINNPDHTPTVVIETPDNPAGAVDASESVFEKGLPARGGEPAGSGEAADGNPNNNSDPSETNTGTIVFNAQDGLQSITVGGVAITTVGQTIQGQFGTLTITSIDLAHGQIGYSYTLTDNTSGDNTQDVFSVVVTDTDGDKATASLTVHIVDDVPTARNDTDTTDDTSHVATGNVITGADTTSGAAGADTVGADNAHVSAITGAGGTDSTADSSGDFTIAGQFGTLTINQDGSYTYTENANAPGGSVDTFTYTLTDGDGDTSTATLTINNPDHVPVTSANPLVQLDDDALQNGNPGGIGDGPDSVNTTGTLSGSGGDGQLNFDLLTTGAPSGFTYVNGPNGSILVQQVQDGHTVTVLTITVNATTGAYTVTQNAPIDHAPGANENNANFTINYTVTDVDGDSANGTLNIQVNDDTPVVTLTGAQIGGLTVDETNLGVDDTKSFASAFSVSFGADGPATSNSLTYTLGISASGADSGLIDTATGNHVFLFLEGGEVVGREGADATAAASGAVVFTVSVDSSGNVTLDQDRAVVHPDATNPDTNEGVSLASSDLVTLTATATDHDGDTASQTLNLGDQLTFQDDGPTISVSGTPPTLTVDETDLSVNATSSFASVFTSSFGADGAGSITYTLGISSSGADSGLIDTATGNHVFLFLEGGEVVGREGTDATAAATGAVVFTVSVDSSGDVTLDQVRAVVHPDGTNPDTSEGVTLASDGLVTLTGTVTDKDGDSSSATANIGNDLVFQDDGPTISASATQPSLTVDETDLSVNATSSFASVFTSSFGADGAGTITYTLGISSSGADSGLIDTATGNHVFLFLEGGEVVGREGTNSTTAATGAVVFTVSIDSSGNVTLDQDRAVVHPDGTNPDTSEGVTLASDGLVTITGTITDKDGDSASATADIGKNLNFDDDGPTISATGRQPSLTVDETNLAVNDTASFAGVFTALFGADGPATVNSLTYTLGISSSGADSGLIDTATGNHVFLFLEGGEVVGREGTNATTAATGAVVFTVSVDSSGNVTLDQDRAVVHPDGTNPDTSEGVTLSSDGLVTLTATATDKDGDQASATASIGTNLTFQDDGPTISASATQPSLTVDETNLAVNDSASFASVFSPLFGADGPATLNSLTYTLGVSTSGADSGLVDTGTGNHVFLFLEGGEVVGREGTNSTTAATGAIVFTVSVNSSGTVTLDQVRAVVHPDATNPDSNEGVTLSSDGLVTLTATATDKDGDQASATASIGTNLHFLDDGPTISASTTQPSLEVDESNLAVNDTASFAGVFTPTFGADGPAASNSLIYALGISASGADSGLVDTATGNHVFLFLEGGEVVGREGTNSTTAATGAIVFTVSVDSSGNVTLDQDRAVVHPTASNPDTSEGVSLSADNLVTLTATATDKDGDQASATANIGKNLTFDDDGPTVSGTATTEPTLSVDETNLSVNDSASFAALFSATFGADGPATSNSLVYTLGVSTSGADSGLVDTATGNHVFLFLEGGEIVGREGTNSTTAATGSVVFTVSVDSSGNVTLDQERAVVHPDPTNPDTDETVTLSSDGLITLTATATDKDGDQASHSVDIGQNLVFHDDGPTAINPAGIEADDVAQATIMASLDISDNSVTDNFGADGPGTITFANITNGDDSGFTSGGDHITLWLSDNGQTLEGRTNSTDGTDGTLIFTIHIDQANSQYDFTLDAPIDNGSGVEFNDLTSTKAGNVDIYGIGADATGNPDVDAMLSASNGSTQKTINTDATSIGVGNQSMNPGDSLRIDFVDHMTTDASNSTLGFDYTSHVETNLFDQTVPQVVGTPTVVSFKVWALETTDTDTNFPDSNPAVGGSFTNSSDVFITEVGITGHNAGETKVTFDISGLAVGSTQVLAYGVSVTRNADGSVTFSGIEQGDRYEIGTGSNTFNAVDVVDVTGKFDLGVFALGTTNQGHPLNLSYDLNITDGDGDSVSVPGAIAITLDPAGTVGSTPIIINNSVINNSVSTQSTSHIALSSTSLMPSNDNGEHQRAFSVGGNAALMGAFAAAGLEAEQLSMGGHQAFSGPSLAQGMTPLENVAAASVAGPGHSIAQPAQMQAMPVMDGSHAVQQGGQVHDMVEAAHPLVAGHPVQPLQMSELLHGSNGPGHAVPASASAVTAAAVMMPSAQQLAAATGSQPHTSVAGNAQHDQVVAKVLADALHGGAAHSPTIDALVNSLPGHAGGGNAALQALASHGGAAVSIEHMAMAGPFGGPHSMLSVDMVMHQDAPPPAHG